MYKFALVTGGLGFVGHRLVDFLCKKDFIVTIVDDMSHPCILPEQLPINVNFFHSKVSEFTPSDHYECIFHLASPVGPAGVLPHAGKMGAQIVQDGCIVASWAKLFKSHLVCVSTSEVYGPPVWYSMQSSVPQVEDLYKTVPSEITVRLEYGVGKLLEEIALLNLHRVKGLDVVIIRPFNIVGPYQDGDAGFVMPRFISQAINNEPFTIFEDGKQIRCFTHVDDIVEGIYVAYLKGKSGEVYNLGNPSNKISIRNLARLISNMLKKPFQADFVDPKEIYGEHYAEAWNKIPNIDKAIKDLNWSPVIELEEIIKDTARSMGVNI